jgi:uncharacterized protein
MRRNDHDISDREELEAVLRETKVCRLGCSDDGCPYIVPLSFGYSDGAIYLHSAPAGHKIAILKKNPDCCVEVDECREIIHAEKPCHWGMHYRSVLCRGRAHFISDPGEKQAGLNCIMDHYGSGPYSFSEKELQGVCVIRIDISEMTGKKSGC